MQIAICDDDKSIGLILEEKIKKLLPDAVIEKYLSGDELIASGCEPDILFLDIQMPGMDGMETARILRQKNERMVLIFVTAVEEYVFQAFDVAAFHYLVKPFSDEKFEEVVKRAVRSIEKYSENQSDEKYMMVQSGGSHMKVFLKDIVYAEVYNRKVIIHTRDTNIEYYGKLQELSEIAGADFFRTHRAYLVHFKYVQKYDANCVTMENGTALIAKQNYSCLLQNIIRGKEKKSDEFGRKMLDGYIENFCYCTPYDYRNLFWKICLSLYKKEKRGCGSQYCLYYDYACFIYDSATD